MTMNDDAVQTVSNALAETSWLSVPCPPEYLPALARDVLYALREADFEVVGPLPPWQYEYVCFPVEMNPRTAAEARILAALLLAAANAAESVAVAASREKQ